VKSFQAKIAGAMLMHWRAKLGTPIEIDVKLTQPEGLVWFWLSRQAGQTEEELSPPTVGPPVGAASYFISVDQIREWGNREAYLLLTIQGAYGSDIPVIMSVKQNDAILEARDTLGRTTNNNSKGGGFRAEQLCLVSAATVEIIPFRLRFFP
jgi:hypothetical protein